MGSRHTPGHEQVAELAAPAGATRLVAIGDPHGAVDRVRRLLDGERNAQTQVVTVGDVIGYADGDRCSDLVALLDEAQVPSVRGNHEDWVRGGGVMLIGEPGGNRQLRPGTLDITDQWPWDLRVDFDGDRSVHITHSLHASGWDWVTEENTQSLLTAVAPAAITCIGHSHRPALYRLRPGRTVEREPFHFTHEEALDWPIEPDVRYVIDCGSLARPEMGPTERNFNIGTYGVVDFAAATVGLRRVP